MYPEQDSKIHKNKKIYVTLEKKLWPNNFIASCHIILQVETFFKFLRSVSFFMLLNSILLIAEDYLSLSPFFSFALKKFVKILTQVFVMVLFCSPANGEKIR